MTKDLHFGITGIELVSFSLTERPKTLDADKKIDFNFFVEHQYIPASKSFVVFVNIGIVYDEKVQLGKLKVACLFAIESISNFFDEAGSVISELPIGLTDALNSVSFSTSRGVAFMAFKGTYLHHLTIPVINISEFRTKSE